MSLKLYSKKAIVKKNGSLLCFITLRRSNLTPECVNEFLENHYLLKDIRKDIFPRWLWQILGSKYEKGEIITQFLIFNFENCFLSTKRGGGVQFFKIYTPIQNFQLLEESGWRRRITWRTTEEVGPCAPGSHGGGSSQVCTWRHREREEDVPGDYQVGTNCHNYKFSNLISATWLCKV